MSRLDRAGLGPMLPRYRKDRDGRPAQRLVKATGERRIAETHWWPVRLLRRLVGSGLFSSDFFISETEVPSREEAGQPH